MYAYALLLLSLVVMVLIGQRMPLVLMVLGLIIVAILIQRLRPAILATALVGALLLAASPVVAPSAYYRLIEKFSNQLEHFAVSPYGQLYARAWEIGRRNPVTGMGFDGFGTGCPQPRYFRPTFDNSQPDGGGATICWDHPHNFYLQALNDGGFIGLALFCATRLAWLVPLGSRSVARPGTVAGRLVRRNLRSALADPVVDRVHQHADWRRFFLLLGSGNGRGASAIT